MADIFNQLETAIKGFDKYYQYSDNPGVYSRGTKQRAKIMGLYDDAVREDESKAKSLYKKLMKQDPPKSAKDIEAAVKANEEKVLKAIMKQLQKEMNWGHETHERNWHPAAFVCQAYRTLGKEPRAFVDSEINRLSKGRYKDHANFCINLFQRVLNKNRK